MIEVKHLEKYYGSDGTVTKAIVFTLLYGIYFAICFTSLRKEIIFTD